MALLEACDVTKNSRHLSRHPVFYKEFRHQVKTASNGDFFMLDTKNNTSTSTMHGFSHQIYLKKLKTCTFNQNGLTTLTSYLVTIETDHHWTWLKMRARDERTAAENIRYLCFILQEKKTQKNLGGWWRPSPLVLPRVEIKYEKHTGYEQQKGQFFTGKFFGGVNNAYYISQSMRSESFIIPN